MRPSKSQILSLSLASPLLFGIGFCFTVSAETTVEEHAGRISKSVSATHASAAQATHHFSTASIDTRDLEAFLESTLQLPPPAIETPTAEPRSATPLVLSPQTEDATAHPETIKVIEEPAKVIEEAAIEGDTPLPTPPVSGREAPETSDAKVRLIPGPALNYYPRRLVLRLHERRVYVLDDNQPIASYPVGIGKTGWATPTGQFKVMQKIVDPVWKHPWNGNLVPPGPNNPLGTRWIGFWSDGQNLIGFHGTIDESLIGQAVSHGCVRMKNADVAALFDLVKEGTPVTVEP